jgi:hypothetical protein
MRRLILAACVTLAAACSRTSSDPDAAYFAIFRAPAPAFVHVKNAMFWENRHLVVFYEYRSVVELEVAPRRLQELMSSLGKKLTDLGVSGDQLVAMGGDPIWFAPHDGSTYQVWRSEDGTVLVIRNVRTGRVFFDRSEL